MGQQLEPYVSSSTKLQRAGKGFTLTRPNSHWLLSPITATMNPQDFRNRIFELLNGRGCGLVPGRRDVLLATRGVVIFFVSYSKKKKKEREKG